jgi:hypothetical protein
MADKRNPELIAQDPLRRQLDGEVGGLWAWRLLRLPAVWWREFQVLVGESVGADVLTQADAERLRRILGVPAPSPARMTLADRKDGVA